MLSISNKELNVDSKNYKMLLEILSTNSSESRLVGGCVRDAILGNKNTDIDIATSLLPHQVIDILVRYKIKFILTGVRFGTVTAFIGNETFEITTLRLDTKCDGRHAEVTFTARFDEDAMRRDFTINALSYCPFKKQIYDYYTGLKDLQLGQVKFIGNASSRIVEDFLRILRFFRFSSLYAKQIDQEALAACCSLRANINKLSKERIKQEMDKILYSCNFSYILKIMYESEILSNIFPIASINISAIDIAQSYTTDNHIDFQLYTKYAIIFYPTTYITERELIKLKFSKKEAFKIFDIIYFIRSINVNNYCVKLKESWIDKEDYQQYFLAALSFNKINTYEMADFVFKYDNLLKPSFPLVGTDLVKLGIEGAKIRTTLNNLKILWIKNDFLFSKQQLLNSL